MERYLFHIVIGSFLFGVAVCTVVPVSLFVVAWLFVMALGLLVLWRMSREATHAPHVFLIALCLLAFCVGTFRTHEYGKQFGASPLRTEVGTKVTLTGVVIEEPDKGPRSQQLIVDTGTDKIIVSTNTFTNIAYGDEISVKGTLKIPEAFTTDTGRTFDYQHYLLAKEIEYTVSFAEVRVLSSGHGYRFISLLLSIKHTLMNGIESVIREPEAGLGEGLLLGVKQALGKDIQDDFRTAGIVHIVVLSGYNIMLIVVFSLALLSHFCSRRVRIFIGMGLVISFALMVGLSATVVRASIMALLFLTAELLRRTYDISRSLLLAAALMVFVSPYLLLYDIGFQLSFMATVGLILVAPKLESLTTYDFGVKEYLVSTIATQIAVLPLLLYYMGQISLVAIVTNLLVLPAVPLAMLLTAFAGFVSLLIHGLALPAAWVAEFLLSYIIKVAQFAAHVPFATVAVPEFPPSLVPLSYLVMSAGLWWWYHKGVSTPDPVADWTIEDEDEFKAKVGAERSSAPTPETPVFFR